MAGKLRGEDKRNLRRFRRSLRRSSIRELLVVPDELLWLLPLRLSSTTGVLDNHPHARGLHMLADFAQNPHTGMIEPDDHARTFGRY